MREATFQFKLIPCPRHRHSKWGTYMPSEYTKWKDALADKLRELGWPLLEGAVSVYVCATYSMPASWSKKKREAVLLGGEYALPAGDVDNTFKSLGDAMTKAGVWHDDKQVAHLSITKQYGLVDEFTVRVTPWTP